MYSIIICVVYVTLFVASHLLLLQYQVVICSPLLQLFLLLMSALYTLYHTYMCYSYIHIFNYNMCYSYISYHNVTLCALHPHPYYTIHHHQHSHQLTLKLWNEFDWPHFDRHNLTDTFPIVVVTQWTSANDAKTIFCFIILSLIYCVTIELRGVTVFWPDVLKISHNWRLHGIMILVTVQVRTLL